MSMPGRNDPCPCGSGKKYKKCHGATSAVTADSVYDRMRRLDAEAGRHIMKFAAERYGDASMAAAWKEFFVGRERPISEDEPEYQFFCAWFQYDWKPEGASPLAECFLSDRRATNIDAGLRRLIEATIEQPYSFYQVTEVEPGTGFKARDVVREIEVNITERSASGQIEK
ncbi:MAG TPA: SEC-C metal-binding domain-containing protein, partial [Bacteroidota bacterium]|nr:SEC-C metal-binding domain-containing protein [Bacteroidota bacterium]